MGGTQPHSQSHRRLINEQCAACAQKHLRELKQSQTLAEFLMIDNDIKEAACENPFNRLNYSFICSAETQ